MKNLTTMTLLLSACASLAAESDVKLGGSKLIATLDANRQLGYESSKSNKSTSKSSSSSKSTKSSNGSSGSHGSSKSNKSSHYSSKSEKSSHRSNKSSHREQAASAPRTESVSTEFTKMDLGEEDLVMKTAYLNDGIAKDYSGATVVGLIATMALLWN